MPTPRSTRPAYRLATFAFALALFGACAAVFLYGHTSAAAGLQYRSKQSGNWNAASTWETSVDGNTWIPAVTTPTSSDDTTTVRSTHVVTVTAAVSADQVTVNSGGILFVAAGVTFTLDDGAGDDLTVDGGGIFAAAGSVTNNGQAQVNGTLRIDDGGFPGNGTGTYAYHQTTGVLFFNHTSGTYGVNNFNFWPTTNGPQNVSVGTASLQLNVARTVGLSFETSAGVFGANNLTIGANGTFTLFTGGFVSGSPTYTSGSTLKYATGGPDPYGRAGEWLANVTSGAGYPSNVQVSANTTLDMTNGGFGPFVNNPSQMGGNLTIDSGSALSMNQMAEALTVIGNVTNNGTLTLSTASGGDIKLQGNWQDNGTFNSNSRAVFFEGAGAQTINRTPAATETFNYLVVNKNSNGVQLLTNVEVNATTGNALQLLGGATPLDLNAKTLTMSGNGGNLRVEFGGHTVTSSSGTGTFAFAGTKSLTAGPNSTLTFDANVVLNLSAGVNFGSVSTVGGTLSIKSGGFVDTNPPTYGGGSTLEYDNGTTYNAAAEFPATGVRNVRLASTTLLTLNGDKTVEGTLDLGANKVDAGAYTLAVGGNGSVTNSTGYVIGTLQKSFSGASDVSFTFPVGTANGYSPVNAESLTGTGSLSVKATQTRQPNVTGTDALSRYWTLSGSGLTTDLSFNYLDGDVAGDENNYKVFKYDGTFTMPVDQSVNAADNFATVSGVSSFSDWTLAEPASVLGPPISGTKTVCDSGCDYVNLTGPSGLFAAINGSLAVEGNIVAQIKGDLAEGGEYGLNQWTETGGGGYTLTIEPFDGTTKTISGNVAAGMIRLDGADRVTIDGRSGGAGRFLTFRNTSASGPTIQLSNDASDDTVRSSVIEGALVGPAPNTTPDGGVVTFGAGATTGNDNNTVTDNQIRDLSTAAGVPMYLVYSKGTSASVNNSNNTVSDNEIFNFSINGIYVAHFDQGANDSWTITGNDIHASAASAFGITGILLGATGTNDVSRNVVHDLTGGVTAEGIYVREGSATNTVSGNRVYSVNATGDGSLVYGIDVFSEGGTSSADIVNNMVSLVPSATNSQFIAGIYEIGESGATVNLLHNTVLVGGTASGSDSTWACLRGVDENTSVATWRNNVCFNNRTGGTGSHFAAGDQSTDGSFSSDYNVFVGTGATASDFMDYGEAPPGPPPGTPVSFATWQSSTGGDAHSLASNPGGDYTVANMFTSATDLHLNTAGTNPASNSGTPVGSVTNDFDNDTRDAAIPDIGADEVLSAVMFSFSSDTYSVGEGGGVVNVVVKRTGSSVGDVAVMYSTSDDTATAGSDYTTASDVLTWSDGDTSDRSFNVNITDDGDDEPNETFNVALSLPAGGVLGTPNTAVVTINDDDTSPTFATLVVDTTDDTVANDGFCSLREAITNANNNDQSGSTDCAAGIGADIITFAPALTSGGAATINLASALPNLSSDMTITGPGANLLDVHRNVSTPRFRIFTVTAGVVANISGLTVTNGLTSPGAPGQPGGGIRNQGTLTLTGVAVVGNQTGNGAGCANCTGGRGGDGGGISNDGTLSLVNSTVSGNQTGLGGNGFNMNGRGADGGSGGGINNNGTLTVTNSTVSGNQTAAGGTGNLSSGVGGSGGGISNNGTLTVSNSTITANTSANQGGGIRVGGGGITLRSTIVASNSATTTGPDISGTVQSDGFNLVQNTNGATINPNGGAGPDITGQDPLLLPLADNGGPTQTHALAGGSPAIDKGKAFGQTTDQRGLTRPTDLADANYPNASGGDGTDIGAFEHQSDPDRPSVVSVVRASADPTSENTVVDFTVTFSESVTGVDSSDFVVTTSGGTGAAVTNVAGSGATYTVSVNTGTGASSVRLDVVDDDSIKDADNNPLGGPGAGNGNFTAGESYTVQPSFTISDVTMAEGNSGTTAFVFTVTKTGSGAASVDFETSDYTAEAGSDYTAKSGTLSFDSADTTKQITVLVNGDTTPEIDEEFDVNLSNATGATIADDYGTGFIRNDEESVSAGQFIISEFRLRGPGLSPEEGGPPPDSLAAKVLKSRAALSRPSAASLRSGAASSKSGAPLSPCHASGKSAAPSAAIKQRGRAEVLTSTPAAAEPDTSPEANDEFIELYNNTDDYLLVTTTDGSEGWAVAASDGVVRFIVPQGTVIPPRGHFLSPNLLGYSLYFYPAGDDSFGPPLAFGDYVIRGDGTDCFGYEVDIPDNAGIALFRTSNPANFTTDTRLDAVGSTAETNTLYKEGAGYPALTPEDISKNLEHSFFRSLCSYGGTACTTPGLPKDTGDNAADFLFVDTEHTATAAGQRLGAPGPENLSSPIQRNGQMSLPLIDRTVSNTAPPNRVRSFTSDPSNNSTFGTLSIRRRVTNHTGSPVTALRFRIIELTTAPATLDAADLRARDADDIPVVAVADEETCTSSGAGSAPCDVSVEGTILEQPSFDEPGQPHGGGLNSSLAVGSVTFDYPLEDGASINVNFLLGIEKTGSFRFLLNIEAVTDECSCPDKPAKSFKPSKGTARRR